MDGQILEGKRILVVDDEPDVLETVKEILASSQVVAVGSFDEALAHSLPQNPLIWSSWT